MNLYKRLRLQVKAKCQTYFSCKHMLTNKLKSSNHTLFVKTMKTQLLTHASRRFRSKRWAYLLSQSSTKQVSQSPNNHLAHKCRGSVWLKKVRELVKIASKLHLITCPPKSAQRTIHHHKSRVVIFRILYLKRHHSQLLSNSQTLAEWV